MLSNALRSRSPGTPAFWASIILVLLCLVCAFGAVALAGTKTGAVLALGVALGPIAAYLALTAPMIFPFGLFVLVVPFDNLLALHSFGTITKLIALCSVFAIAARLVLSRKYVIPDKAVLAWAPFLILSIASLVWAMDPMDGIQNVLSLLQFFALYALIAFMPIDRKTLGFVLSAVMAGGVIAGAYGAYLFRHGVNVSADSRLFIKSGTQLIDPNHFAAALLVPFGIALISFVESRSIAVRAFTFAAVLFSAVGILVSGSRGALISVAFMVLYMIFRSRKRSLLIGLSVAGAGVGLATFGHLLTRFNQIAETGGAGRLGIWRVAAVAFWRHPILGAGAGNFANAYNDAFLSVPAFATMKTIEDARWNVAPHNDFIWVAVELGVLGLAALLYAWWMQFKALRTISERSELYPLRVAVEAIVIGQFVCGMFLSTLTYKYLWLAFILAMIVRNAELDKGGSLRENVVSPVLQTAARRS